MSDNDWGIIGHERAVSLLKRSIEGGRVGHSYLFSGPPQIGKTTLALAFAKALNCTGNHPPCGECRDCAAIEKRTHPDVRLIQAGGSEADAGAGEQSARSSKSRVIKIGQIRELQHEVALLPYEGRWKVYIVRYADDMNIEAANSLLKTLEEPPSAVVLLLTALDAKILPSTIASRCQQVSLGPLAIDQVQAALEQRWKLEPAEAKLLAHLSGGRIGWAIDTAGDRSALAERETELSRIADLSEASRAQRFKYVDEVATRFGRQPDEVYATLDLWLGWWRDLLLMKNECSGLVTNINMFSRLSQQAMRYTVEQIHDFLKAIEAARKQLDQNVNAKLALEAMVLSVPQARN